MVTPLQALLVDFSLDAGVFTFRVFKDGKWQHVTIDDRLPATEDNNCVYTVGVDFETNAGHAVFFFCVFRALMVSGSCWQRE